jgi:hypothetical protein
MTASCGRFRGRRSVVQSAGESLEGGWKAHAAAALSWREVGPTGGIVRTLWREADFERHAIVWTDESPESYARFMLESFGPLLNAREALAERADELDEAFTNFLRSENEADDGTLRFRGEYLLSVVKRG